jgi:DNA-binding MarR family transcriptional regulator
MLGVEIKKTSNQVMRAMSAIKSAVDDEIEEAGDVTSVQGWILGYLMENLGRKDIFQKDIERELNIRCPTATKMLNLMEKNDLIKRKPSPDDARFKKLVITEKALKIHNHIEAKAMPFEEKIRRGLSEEEIILFLSILKRIRKNVED